MTAPDIDFAHIMEPVARKLWGDPDPRASNTHELRWGTHGSRCVDLDKGVWSDHEADTGGGVLDLIRRELRCQNGAALAWLRTEGFIDAPPAPKAVDEPQRVAATYDYPDEHGELLYQVVRFGPRKDFRQRRPDPSSRDGWSWSVKGSRLIPYRLPEVLENIRAGAMTFIVEGEKDVENLAKEGICATCNPMGAGKWSDELSACLKGADVVILPDNDDAGRSHAAAVGASLRGVAKRVRVLELPNLPPKGDVSDWLNDGGDAAELLTLAAREGREWAPEAPKSRFGAIPWAAIDTVTVRQDWLIDGLMFCGDIGMIYGASGSGKSFLAVHAGLCIARGVPFLGHDTRRGSVLYQAGEGGKGLVKRLRAYKQENRVIEDVPFVLLPARVDLFSPDGDVASFIDECLAWRAVLPEPLSLIVVDTFSTASPGANENASEDMSRLIRAGEDINKATGAALLWVHHKNAAGDRERGHTSLRANIDTAIEVTKDEESNLRTARLAKLKDGEDGAKIGFELQAVTVGAYDDGKPITSCVVVPAQAATERSSKRRPLPRGQQRFLKTLDAAIAQSGGVVPGSGAYGVAWEVFRDLFVTLCGQGMTSPAIRQTLSRDGNDLWMADLIGRDDHWLWITDKGGIYL